MLLGKSDIHTAENEKRVNYARTNNKQGQAGSTVVSPDLLSLRPVTNVTYDFHMSHNDFSLFPYMKWRQYANRVWREESKGLLFYGNPQGEWGIAQRDCGLSRTI